MMLDIDVRPLLPAIRVPVVILHRADEVAVDVSHSRYMAEHIPGARYVELPGSDHCPGSVTSSRSWPRSRSS